MTRTILATLVIAGAMGGVSGLRSATAADAGAVAPQLKVDCWIGMKFGDKPGELIRGWTCHRQDRPAAQQALAADTHPVPTGKSDVAAIDAGSLHR
jgi:hypothetical protein